MPETGLTTAKESAIAMAITVAMAITIAMAIARPGAKMVALRQMDVAYAFSVFQNPGGARTPET